MLCQLYGTKDLWLASPDQSKHLYTYPASVTKSRTAPDRPDLDAADGGGSGFISVARDFEDVGHITKNPAFEPLRSHEDF